MQHFQPLISNDASLSGNSFPIVTSHGLAGSKSHHCLSPLKYKAKAHSRYGRNIVGSERWQRQPQQQSHVLFQCLGSSEDTTDESKNMDATCKRKSSNVKRTRKRTRLIHVGGGTPIEIHSRIISTQDRCISHNIYYSTS